MDQIPQDIYRVICQFVDDRSRKVLRLANTTWFNITKFNKFELQFTRPETLPTIVDRLSKYQWPISVSFWNHFLVSGADTIRNISRLTNLFSLNTDTDFVDLPSFDDWMQLTTLINIEKWDFMRYDTPIELLGTFTNLREWIKEADGKDLRLALRNLTKLEEVTVDASEWPSAIVPNPSRITKLTYRINSDRPLSPDAISEFSEFVNLKWLDYWDMHETPYITSSHIVPILRLTALEYLALKMDSPPDLQSNVKLTSLRLYDISNYNYDTLTALTNLKLLELTFPAADFKLTRACFMTALTALNSLNFYFFPNQPDPEDIDIVFEFIPTTLKQLQLNQFEGANVDCLRRLPNLEELWLKTARNFSSLQYLTNLTKFSSQDTDSVEAIGYLTNLKSLDIWGDGFVEDFPNLEKMTNLRSLVCDKHLLSSNIVNKFNSLPNLESLDLMGDVIEFQPLNYEFLSLPNLVFLRIGIPSANQPTCEEFWIGLAKATQLKYLFLPYIDKDERILVLTSFKNLVQLGFNASLPSFTGEYLTTLMNLQSFSYYGNARLMYNQESLKKYLPYMTHLHVFVPLV